MHLFARFMGNEILNQKKYIRNFSAGNRQKIGIVGALMVDTPIVILDEPFNFLDPTSQLLIRDILATHSRQTGATVWVSSHNLNHIADLCDRVVVLKDGEVFEDMDNAQHNVEGKLNHYFSL
jgi:ABC-2 type transport system ATP-binding protein